MLEFDSFFFLEHLHSCRMQFQIFTSPSGVTFLCSMSATLSEDLSQCTTSSSGRKVYQAQGVNVSPARSVKHGLTLTVVDDSGTLLVKVHMASVSTLVINPPSSFAD